MHIATGIDIIEISRIKKSLESPRFLLRFFGDAEKDQFASSGRKASYIAGNFCAKEAFAKALGRGVRGFSLREIEVLRNPIGKPYLAFSGCALDLVRHSGLAFELSVSHTKDYAVAIVIAYRDTSIMGEHK